MERKGTVYALGAAALFGASTPAAKLLLRDLPPVLLSAILYLGAAIALSGYRLLPVRESGEAQITGSDLPLIGGVIVLGGMLGPILMLVGLAHLSAVTASLLLNLEGPFTALIAIGLMGEHLSGREIVAALTVMLGGALISFQAGGVRGDWIGTAEIAAAALCWGIDNNLTQRISLRDPVSVSQIKTLAAGSCVLVIALGQGSGHPPGAISLICAVGVGALGYGVSIVLDVRALRLLGAAREAAYFATAPFIGALVSIAAFRELPTLPEFGGATLMIAGLAVLIRERHSHLHTHEPAIHGHRHFHDEHHRHDHEGPVTEPHAHPHEHSALMHDHPHVSDVHHRHSHRFPK